MVIAIDSPKGMIYASQFARKTLRREPLRLRWVVRSPLLIRPETDLSLFVGRRVELQRTLKGVRYTWRGVFTQLWHSVQLQSAAGMLDHEAYGVERHAGSTAIDLPYLNATIKFL
jgi:hypothetical protein